MAPLTSFLRAARHSKTVALTSKLLTLVILLTLTSGCGVFHYVFYPPVECACSPENRLVTQQLPDPEQEDESEVVYEEEYSLSADDQQQHAADDHEEHEEHEEEGDENEVVADIETGELKGLGLEETNEGANTRTRPPGSESPAQLHEQAARLERAHQIADVIETTARVDISSSKLRSAAEQKYGVSLSSDQDLSVMTGDFFPDQDNLAIITPGNSIKIYAGGRLAAQRPLPKQESAADLSELTKDIVLPVRLVQNSALQILIHSAEPQPDGAIFYKARIYKVFGNEIGLIFEETIARRDTKDQPIQRLGQLEFLQGMNHRFIRWTTLDKNGKSAAEPQILRWNRWEGTYRVPMPPPTAPKNQS